MSGSGDIAVLHYLGYAEDSGGIVSVVRALSAAGRFRCVLGMSTGAIQRLAPPLEMVEFAPLEAERLRPALLGQTLRVARQAQAWLRENPRRVFHGHSRAGLLVALWLQLMGERRVVVSVHTFGRQRWLYRLAVAVLGRRLFCLSPAMKRYYGVHAGTVGWEQCLPGCIPALTPQPPRVRDGKEFVFAAVGPFASYKRWDLLIAALGQLAPEIRRRVRLIQAGAEETKPAEVAHAAELRALAAACGVTDLIEWRGRVVPISGLWAAVDCLVVPSPSEAFPVVAMEALAAGVPVLASDRSGTSDLLDACDGGWRFAGDSSASLAALMTECVEKNRRAVTPRPDQLLRFTAPKSAEAYLEVYCQLLGP